MLATGSLVSTTTAFRLGAGCLELLVQRTPPLMRLGVTASASPGNAGKAQAAFRDELVALARDSVEVSWRELRRGVDDFDAFTRPEAGHSERAPRRPHRVKR
jgi:hypothetical protein